MNAGSRVLLVAISPWLTFFVPMTAVEAQSHGSWDGTWTGLLNNRAPIAVSIAGDKVVSYAIEGAPFAIHYSKVTPTSVSFGDGDHYAVNLTKTGDATASEIAHGRHGFGRASLTKQ
jgi:hypothetical protein